MKIWVTKYALTQGILEYDGAQEESFPGMVCILRKVDQLYFHKPFWHTTREAAVEHANKMRERKIASLQKQIQKLSKPIE